MKKLIAIALLAVACTTGQTQQGLVISGQSLLTVSQQFVQVAQAFKTGCDTSHVILPAQCHSWSVFEAQFKKDYPQAVQAWEIAHKSGNAAQTQKAEAVIVGLVTQLAAFATQVH